jgi:hydroxypyruvate isomerase
MNRRTFLGTGVSLAATGTLAGAAATRTGGREFKLKYAPHFGMFRHHAGEDLIDQLKFMADQGFRALEDNGMKGRSVEVQGSIARGMERLNMEMGVFVAAADFRNVTFASSTSEAREKILADIRDSVEVARRVNAKWCTVVPGCFDPGLEWDYQTANVIDNLKYCVEICEPAGLVMVLEPLNAYRDHPGLFLTRIPQAYQICRAVGSPSCKILDDLYHQQITEGNLIPNMDRAWEEIPYFQIGDNPGRREPTTGEINYKNIFRHIHSKGFTGILGMEHGSSRPGVEGEKALIEAYVECDSFQPGPLAAA